MSELTHFNAAGEAHMVDVAGKAPTRRVAVAAGRILMRPETAARLREGGFAKGDVLGVARIAGIMAAKRTAELIPLCHPLPLSHAEIGFELGDAALECRARVETVAPTGVEMEAIVAVQIALATVYDMCKAVDRAMRIEAVRLVHKSGGRSGVFEQP